MDNLDAPPHSPLTTGIYCKYRYMRKKVLQKEAIEMGENAVEQRIDNDNNDINKRLPTWPPI